MDQFNKIDTIENENVLTKTEETEIEDVSIFDIDEMDIIEAIESVEKKGRKKKITDKELVQMFYDDMSHENFNKLWKRFYYGLKKFSYAFLKDNDMAEDAVIQTFENAWNKRDTYDVEKGAYSTWLYRICRNICLGVAHQKAKDNYIDYDISDCYDSVLGQQSAQDLVSIPNDNFVLKNGKMKSISKDDIIKRMYDVSVYEINHGLDEKFAVILRDKLINNKKLRQISEELNMNISNVKNRLYGGKFLLNEIIKTKYPDLFAMYLDVINDANNYEYINDDM